MKHPGDPGTIPYIQHYTLQTTPSGKIKWDLSDKEFDKIEELIDYHMLVEEKLPCRLILPEAIMKAKNLRELQSLAVFEEEFWKRGNLASEPLIETKEADTTRLTPPPSASSTSSSSVANSYQIPPMSSPVGNEHQRKPSNYRSLLSPMSPQLAKTEYENMPVSPKPSVPLMSQASFPNYSPLGYQETRPYQGLGFENQLKGTQRPVSVQRVQSSSSVDLSLPLQRQPMRYSTQSERDSLVNDTGKRYPPPACAPPPPPPATGYKDNTSRPQSVGRPQIMYGSTPLAMRQSLAYYTPFETTKSEHSPMFRSQAPVTAAPPIPTKATMSSRALSMYPPYQMPYTSATTTTTTAVPVPYSYSEPARMTAAPSGYSTPPMRPSSTSSVITQETKEQQRLSDSGVFLEPIRVSGPSIHTTDPLDLFDPLAQSNIVEFEESLPPMRERLLSLELKSEKNSNMNSNSKTSNPNSNNRGAKPVVLTSNLITLYDEDVEPEDVLPPEADELRVSSGEELEENEAIGEGNTEDSTGSGSSGSDFTSSQEMPSGSTIDDVSMESEEPVDDSKKAVEKFKRRDHRKNLTKSIQRFGKFVKKKTTQLERKNKSLKVVGIRKTYKKKIDPAKDIRSAIDSLATNPESAFSAMLAVFIQDSRVKAQTEKPDLLMRDIRQFMTGMKNFLFNRQVPQVDSVMDKYPDLSMSELDAIVEGALHLYILKPLKDDIYQCFINEVKSRNGSLAILDHNIQTAKLRSMEELGIKSNYVPPHMEAMSEIKSLIIQMELSFSPIKKLDYLLQIVTSVYNTVVDKNSGREVVQSMGADDFLPMFIYVLVQCEAVNIEVEADYMWGLLEPSKLSGEGGYYLTTLSSAICILKQFEQETQSETKGFLSVMVAMETNEIIDRTIPVLPGMTAADICRIISHKMQIENAEDDYHLYLIADKEVPRKCEDSWCPMYVKSDIETKNKNSQVRFGYRHKKRQVEWPPPSEE
ncbi:uncharacterized protein [Amphiura filiformis]|uniref:uncharacterized protein isoform X1 n=1 Tax=Amphiura filiformis TaxID=82378 RepID=UPI003B20FC9C